MTGKVMDGEEVKVGKFQGRYNSRIKVTAWQWPGLGYRPPEGFRAVLKQAPPGLIHWDLYAPGGAVFTLQKRDWLVFDNKSWQNLWDSEFRKCFVPSEDRLYSSRTGDWDPFENI